MSQTIVDRILEEQDREFTRVLEDLIEVLIAQGVISLDMLPEKAVEKLEQRRYMRAKLASGATADPQTAITH